MEIKTYRARIAIKADGDQGQFTAAFATLNVIDHDHDVTLRGAFGEQQVLIEPWNHTYDQPPVGKGVIGEEGEEALVQGRFFLETQAGAEHYIVVKELADLQEWSYSFYIVEDELGMFEGQKVRFLKKLDVIGVGPVSRGAGIGTHTVDIKGLKPEEIQAIHDHAVSLGAKCSEGEEDEDTGEDQDEDPEKGKSRSPSTPSTDFYRTRIEIENLDI